jgi:hypothetical protein
MHKLEMPLGRHTLSIETGRMAKQADGAVLVRLGDTVVLATACAQKEPRVGVDFMPLTVDYRENTYAGGKIPGGFFKREGRPNEKEILTSRMIDRPLRPLFEEGYACETQVIGLLLSADMENDSDTLNYAIFLDEPLHLGAAAAQTWLGDFRVNPEDPPLWKYWAMLPHQRGELALDTQSPLWESLLDDTTRSSDWGARLLYQTPGNNDGDEFLGRSRFMMILLGPMLCLLAAWWSYQIAPAGGSTPTN